MRVALIPPIPDLTSQATTDIHLLLSHLVSKPGYVEHYRKRKERGDYLILDNSAHEHGTGNSAGALLRQAAVLGADEIVCSDVLFDAKGTARHTEAMLEYIITDGWELYFEARMPRLMLVPQGRDERSWASCLRRLMYLWDTYMSHLVIQPPVIGVSKDYDDMVRGGITRLITRYCKSHVASQGADVHCLGWPANLWSLAKVCREAPWVRSADSAKPFVYAQAGVRLEPGGPVPTYPHRTSDYFDRPLDGTATTARINVEVFKAAANDELIE